jgi:hypothetical protein
MSLAGQQRDSQPSTTTPRCLALRVTGFNGPEPTAHLMTQLERRGISERAGSAVIYVRFQMASWQEYHKTLHGAN